MRNFFRSSFITLFVLLLPITLLLALPRLNGYNAEKLKAELRRQGVYEQLSSYIGSHVTSSNTGGLDIPAALLEQVKSELTAAYLQGKVEGVIDGSAAWITGRSATPPTVSFNDLKQSLLAKNPGLAGQLTEFQQQFAKYGEAGSAAVAGQLDQQQLDPQTKAQIQQLLQQSKNAQSVAQGDYTVSLEQLYGGFKTAYQVYSIALPVLVVLLVVLAVAIVLLGVGASGRLAGLGWGLAVAAVWNGLLVLVVHLIQGLIESKVTGVAVTPGQPAGWSGIAYHSLVNTLMANYLPIEISVSVGLFIAGVVLIIVARIMKRQAVGTGAAAVRTTTVPVAGAATLVAQPGMTTSTPSTPGAPGLVSGPEGGNQESAKGAQAKSS